MQLLKFKIIMPLVLLAAPLCAQTNNGLQLLVTGGVFAPQDDGIEAVYGDGPQLNVALGISVGKTGRLRLGGSYFEQDGNPFFDIPDFDGGNLADLRLTGLAMTLETHALTRGWPRIYFGAGVDYLFARERISGLRDATGRSVGAHFAVTPELKLSTRLRLVSEVRYRFLEVNFRAGDQRYEFDLSGTNLSMGLAYTF